MDAEKLYQRYQELQRYVGWTAEDAKRIQAIAVMLEPRLPALVDDFYAEIERHPDAMKVITGGQQQIARLKGTLLNWLQELLAGPYEGEYVMRRWKVGLRHVEIGLDQVFTNVALSRLRKGLQAGLVEVWSGTPQGLLETRTSLNSLVDLDLTIIEDAYQAEQVARQQRSERLAAIGQVAGGIAHELRNPLNVVKTSVYYLLHAKNPTAAKQAEHLARIDRHVTLADGVITALSSFAKMPVPDLQPFPVEQCVQEALETNPGNDNLRVTLDFPSSLPPVLGDLNQLRIVFANLIRNAREAMPQGGSLSIQGRLVNDAVEVTVTDTGVGISADDLHRIMEPLYSTKARGLGLGLAIARAILDKNKGTMLLTSELGKGSSFSVRLTALLPEEPNRS
ncbi:MAG: PAS domain-containing sensor histidine kinase [Planctomycetes bacterium]|nr:PAS domain-containing sensor histidine kinase [Planctomycetota bacterium]